MTFKTFLSEALILEGGAAIKGSHPLTQAEAREIGMQVIRDLKVKLNIPASAIALVGSAGLKEPDQLSGDIDVAVEADVTLVKTAVEQLALNGQFRHMPGLNVYSFARLHGSKVAQVDIIPTTNLKLAKWAYYNSPNDLKLGLKGSHRNELLFAIAKYAEYKVTAKAADGQETARSRLTFDLSRGLYRSTQDKAGKRGITKSFKTTDKALITNDPDKICAILFGSGVTAKQVMTYADAFKLMMSSSFPHKAELKEILKRAVEGLESKKLVVPHDLRQATTEKLNEEQSWRELALKWQAAFVEALPSKYDIKLEKPDDSFLVAVYDGAKRIYRCDVVAARKGFEDIMPQQLELYIRSARRAVFIWSLAGAGFKRNVAYDQYQLELEDRLLYSGCEEPLTIYIGTHNRIAYEYVRVRDLEKVDEAIVYAKHAPLHDFSGGKTPEKIFEEVEYSKRVLLSLQQKLIDFETPRGRELDSVSMSGGVLRGKIKCQHYDWTLSAAQAPLANKDRLKITLQASGGDYDSEMSYVIRRMPNEQRISLFVDGGMLTDGDDEAEFDTWEQALDKFMSELTAIFSDQGE